MKHHVHSSSTPRSKANRSFVRGRRPGICCLGLLTLICCLTTVALDCNAEPVLLRDAAFVAQQRPGVPFDHDRHSESLDCTRCHHAFENDQNIWEPDMETRCSACHQAGDGSRLGLRQVWHRQCMGCHAGERSAPVMCGECHVRGDGGKP